MDFRRIPFQFSSTDPAKRQAELQKRFGLPVNTSKDKMHIDFEKSGLMGFRPNEKSSASNSPRLQHRVPVFVEGDSEPMNSSVDSQGSPVHGRKPHVRVIPIEVEGDDLSTKRHRNLSGPANSIADRPCQNGSTWLPEEFAPYVRPPVMDPVRKPSAVPRERSIPIQVEGVQTKKAKTVPVQKPKSVNLKKDSGPKQACHAPKVEKPVSEVKNSLSGPALSLSKIECVLGKLKTFCSDVEKFTGTAKDKHYRYLDEMLTRLMLELDDIDAMGNEEVRLSRKAAIKQVQASVDLLEAKVTRKTSEESSIDEIPVDVQCDEVEEIQNVEMNMPTAQGGNIISNADSTMPVFSNEKLSKQPSESVPETEQRSEVKIEDVEMENLVCDEHEKKVPEEISETAEDNFQVMEVDKNIECETIAESGPVITTVDNPFEASRVITKSIETINMPIELVNEETSGMKETEDYVVTLAESPVQEIVTKEINVDLPNEDPTCAKLCSQNVSCEDISNSESNKLETKKHSKLTLAEHSSEVPDNEVLKN